LKKIESEEEERGRRAPESGSCMMCRQKIDISKKKKKKAVGASASASFFQCFELTDGTQTDKYCAQAL